MGSFSDALKSWGQSWATGPNPDNVPDLQKGIQDQAEKGLLNPAFNWSPGIVPPKKGPDTTDLERNLKSFEEMSRATSERLAGIGQNPNQEMADRYFQEMDAPIQSQFYNQANQVSSYLARQGLGGSGINVGSHAQLANNAAALEGQARLKATDLAIEKERQGELDKFSTQAMALQPQLQKYGIDVSKVIAEMQMQYQMQALKAQMDAQSASGWGSLLGTVGGGIAGWYMTGGNPMGGMMGAGIGQRAGSGAGYIFGP